MVANRFVLVFFGLMILSFMPGTVPLGLAGEWTLLVYVNGADENKPYGFSTVNQMERIGSTGEVNVVVQWDNGRRGRSPQRFLVSRDSAPERIGSRSLGELSGVDASEWQSFVDFIEWGVERFPAKRYFIITRGVLPSGTSCNGASGLDESGSEGDKCPCLARALREAARIMGHKVDVFGADVDLGATIEVAYELADAVGVFIASQETGPPEGWPYDKLLERLTKSPKVSIEQMARLLIEEYRGAYAGRAEVTLSALDLNQVDSLNDSLRNLSEGIASLDAAERTRVHKAALMTQRFGAHGDADLLDFVRRLQLSAIKGAFDDLGFLKLLFQAKNSAQDLIISNGTSPSFGRANGVSIWMPEERSDYYSRAPEYRAFDFNKKTSWSDALDRFLPYEPSAVKR